MGNGERKGERWERARKGELGKRNNEWWRERGKLKKKNEIGNEGEEKRKI